MKRGHKQSKRALFYKQPRAYPTRLWRHWTYSSTKVVAPAFGSVAPAQPAITTSSAKFRANTIYDPDMQTGGQECIGQADTFMGWDHYIVYYTRMTATFWPWVASTSAGNLVLTSQAMTPVWFGLSLRDQDSSLTGATVRLMNTDRLTAYHTTSIGKEISRGGSFTLTQWFNARSFFNCDPRDRESLIAAPDSNPAEMAYFMISTAPMNPPYGELPNDFGSWNVTVHLDMWGFCMEPKQRGAIP